MTDIIQRLRELDAKATEGPWIHDGGVYARHPINEIVDYCYNPADADLIAEQRNALPDLLAVAEAARGVADLVRELHRVDDRLSPEYMSLIYAVDNLAKHTTNQGDSQ